MGFAAAAAKIWPITPDWADGLTEKLSWATDVMQASATAVSQHRSYRIAPRRSFEFPLVAGGQERRVADMLLAGHSGEWLLPIWPDVTWLSAPLAADSAVIPCDTTGLDFVAGGRALLYRSVNRWELVTVSSVEAGQIALSAPTAAAYGPGDRLYPVRRARVQDGAEEALSSSDVGKRTITFDVVEPCDWPVLADTTTYRTHPVLDVRPDESDDLTHSVGRLLQSVDYGSAPPVVHDLPGIALRAQQTAWKLWGRPERTWFRSLLYTLAGRRVPMWLPSFADDLLPNAAIAGTALPVEWAGYTLFGLGKPTRRDLRIELTDGTVLYRRATGAAQTVNGETLVLDSALSGTSIMPEHVRQISIMALSVLASDDVEIEHVTDIDGAADTSLGWTAVVPDGN